MKLLEMRKVTTNRRLIECLKTIVDRMNVFWCYYNSTNTSTAKAFLSVPTELFDVSTVDQVILLSIDCVSFVVKIECMINFQLQNISLDIVKSLELKSNDNEENLKWNSDLLELFFYLAICECSEIPFITVNLMPNIVSFSFFYICLEFCACIYINMYVLLSL